MNLSIIVTTIGRASLRKTLASFAPELVTGDAVIVMCDGPMFSVDQTVAQFQAEYSDIEWTYSWLPKGNAYWGHKLRNHAIEHYVRTSHLWTIDDDDIAIEGAITEMRGHLRLDGWTVFKMEYGKDFPRAHGLILWLWPQVTVGNIGTPMILAPICQSRFGLSYNGDFEYAQSLQTELGEPEWNERIVAMIRP